MKTIGWGIVQIPIVDRYRACFCLKRDLVDAVAGTGWKLFLQSTLRIILLTMWGMGKIDYTLPQTSEKIIGIYIELAILGLQVADGVATIFSSWFKKKYLLYPALVVIPVSFLIDFFVKAICYGPLFLTPEVTSFGIFSLVEIWVRYLGLLYCWIAIISFLYHARGKRDPFAKKQREDEIRPSRARNPFSRSSTLSMRGRRSFLLKSKQEPATTSVDSRADQGLLLEYPAPTSGTSRWTASQNSGSESEIGVEACPPTNDVSRKSLTNETDNQYQMGIDNDRLLPTSTLPLDRPPKRPVRAASRNKRKGGFIPEVLRAKAEDRPTSYPERLDKTGDEPYPNSETSRNFRQPPQLPRAPPVGNPSPTWMKHKNDPRSLGSSKDQDKLVTTQQQLFFV